ncbi:hypothetical protein P4J13_25415 [Bacillus anthracis]|uniref:hypothetical protein n=1 Tax=Bacillus anthracis TaxID=1392 RepID=UPI002DB78537|nr:hypothetical protein [Bacillus anthracis]MEB9507273.1 hypothetical protein [Bacillus anthracis]
MINNLIAHEKKQLGEEIGKVFQEISSLLTLHSPHKTKFIITEWHAFNAFWSENADLTKISLEETKARLDQVKGLLEQAKKTIDICLNLVNTPNISNVLHNDIVIIY